jgi:hypothetical protein
MNATARLPTLLAVILFLGACKSVAPSPPAAAGPVEKLANPTLPASGFLQPSPRQLVGRVLAVDLAQGFAFVALTTEPPPAALADGAGLTTRTDDLRPTARLRVSRYVRGRTLGTQILSGQPTPGDEVVFQAP